MIALEFCTLRQEILLTRVTAELMIKRRSPKLFCLFVLYLLLFVMILSVSLMIYFSYQYKNSTTDRLVELGEFSVSQIAAGSIDALFSEMYPALNEIVSVNSHLPDIVSVIITNAEKMVVAATDNDIVGKTYSRPDLLLGYKESKEDLYFAKPVEIYGRTMGYVYLTMSKKRIKDDLKVIVLKWIAVNVFIILAIVVMGVFTARHITSSFKNIIDVTKLISSGDYTESVDAKGFYELKLIAGAMNSMKEAIEEREKRIIQTNNELVKTNFLLKSIFNSPPGISIWSVDRNYRYTFFNNPHKVGMENVWGVDIELGKNILDYLYDKADKKDYREFVKNRYDEVLKGNDFHLVEKHTHMDGSVTYLDNYSSPIYNEDNEITGLTIFSINITKQKIAENEIIESLKEKEVLLKEIHHRVKNNLQVVASLLNLQSEGIKNPEDKELFLDSINRINSMAMIHERLYSSSDFSRIDMRLYFSDLVYSIQETFSPSHNSTKIIINVENIHLSINQAVPIGLICNEIFTNSYKYAFEEVDDPEITVTMKMEEDDILYMMIEDNGVGFSSGFNQKGTLGSVLISALTEQLKGTYSIIQKERGVGYLFRFPVFA